MNLLIEIPAEFEQHFHSDRFADSLYRLSADAHSMAGNYEQETVSMLIKAFENAIPAADVVERKKGKWALVEKRRKASVYRCSECGNFFTVWPDTLNCGRGDMNYCCECGADVRGDP